MRGRTASIRADCSFPSWMRRRAVEGEEDMSEIIILEVPHQGNPAAWWLLSDAKLIQFAQKELGAHYERWISRFWNVR